MKRAFMYILIFTIALVGADENSQVVKIKKKGAREANVNINFSKGTLTLQMKKLKNYICIGNFNYKTNEPIVDYNVIGGQGDLTFNTDENVVFDKSDKTDGIKINNFNNSHENDWNIQLDKQMPLSLHLTLAASKNTLQLGGSNINYLSVEAGASKNFIDFDTSTQNDVEDIVIETGASKVVCTGLANTNSHNIALENGLGSTLLDFSGKLTHNMHIRINNGVGKVLIFIPDSMSARFKVNSSFLATFKIDNYSKRDGEFFSPAYNKDKPTLFFEIENAIGKIEILWSSYQKHYH